MPLLKSRPLACLALAFAFAFSAALPARAADGIITWAGVKIAYTNATITTASTGDLILKFIDTTNPGSFVLPEDMPVWYLAVGGGGAGGTLTSAAANSKGAGGGGGAGGFVEVNPQTLNAGLYTVTVGAGGLAATSQVVTPGGKGGNSIIYSEATASEIVKAIGGGGGGANSAGGEGGSGGGGSYDGVNTPTKGGNSLSSQGNAGGDGWDPKYAGAGGGAGGVGTVSGWTSDAQPGGVGKQSQILDVKMDDDWPYYAGGGGGGRAAGSKVDSGGKGGGGMGGRGSSTAPVAAEPGDPNTGGGGGGGGRWGVGANGGSGIVVVRLLMPAIAPTAKTGLIYTGENQTAVDYEGGNWDYVSGDTNAVNAGNYSFTVKPKGDLKWKDTGTSVAKTINWSIGTATVAVPMPTDRTYNGSEQVGVSESLFYTLTGDPKATNVKVVASAVAAYSAVATLNNVDGAAVPNCKWADDWPSKARTLTWTMKPKQVTVPTAITGLAYTGSEQTGVADPAAEAAYSLGGNKGTEAQNYTATATLKDAVNYQWVGGTYGVAETTIAWSIAAQAVAKPFALNNLTNFVYDTTEKGIVVQPSGWTGYATMSGESVTNATAKGDYTATFTLKSTQNYVWVGGGTDPVTLAWHITALPVKPPKAVEGLKYTGAMQTGILDSEDASKYQYDEGVSIKEWTAAGSYKAYVALKDSANCCWADDGTTEQKTISWTIAKADNTITSLKMGGWKFGTPKRTPSVTATWGTKPEDLVQHPVAYYYADSETGPWTLTECPTNTGTHYVHAIVPETSNWLGAEATKKFSIWDNPDDIFRDHVDIRVTGYTGTEVLTNFPLLVRISESRFRGFYYDRAGTTGEEMTFADEKGEQLPYEVDTWNTSGESLVWVRVNTFTNNVVVTMYWAVKDGATPPGYNPEEVWTDYAGVWHFNESIDTGSAPTTFSHDATGHGYEAVPRNNVASGTPLTKMTSFSAGAIGAARTIENGYYKGGCHLSVTNSDKMTFNDNFTFSGWMRIQGIQGSGENQRVFPVARKEGRKDNKGGFAICLEGNTATAQQYLLAHGGGSGDPTRAQYAASATVGKGWYYFGAAYQGNKTQVFGKDGANVYWTGVTLAVPGTDNELPLVFGNTSCGTNTTCNSLNGYVDEYRITPLVRSKAWLEAEYDTAHNTAFCTNALVVKDGLKVNYWLSYPKFEPTQMAVGEEPSVIYNGRLAEGLSITNYVNVYDSTTSSVLPTVQGGYRAVFGMAHPEGYELLEAEKGIFNFTYLGTSPYRGIAGNLGDSGRVLLMNRDTNTKCPIRYQGYSDTTKTKATFWELRKGPDDPEYDTTWKTYNTKPRSESILWTANYGARLWHLVNCRHGNTFAYTDNVPTYYKAQNYLPWSTTSKAITFEGYDVKPSTVGQICMRNMQDATVYSSCFTNGIGAIYFDAVNGWNDNAGYGYYKICVEVCTNVLGDTTGLWPTDANIVTCTEATNEVSGVVYTNYTYDTKGDWKKVPFIPYKRDGTTTWTGSTAAKVSELDLNIRNGGTVSNFYRITVPLDYRGPVRFRIRRLGSDSQALTDGRAFIILDNIIVSYPTMGADLKPTGFFDPEKGGKSTLGQEIALSVPFPAVNDGVLNGRAVPTYYVNPGEGAAKSNDFIVSANLHYRWRYLRQRAEPTATSAQLDPTHAQYYRDNYWRTVPLNPKNGFRTLEPLNIPSVVGDIEFWYDLTMNVPHYEYVDYTGKDFGVPYDETRTAVTNRMASAERDDKLLPTTGQDWFVRLREGQSDYERVKLIVSGALAGEYDMELTDDHMWRCLVKIPTNVQGTCTYYFRGDNLQTPGAYEFDLNNVFWGTTGTGNVTVPENGELKGADNVGAITKMSLTVDHAAGYYEFKMSDRFLTWGVSRAEFQDFNSWHDVWTDKNSIKFTVGYNETNGVDDVMMKTLTSDMLDSTLFDLYVNGNAKWNEPFALDDYRDPVYPKETFYQSHQTPKYWAGHNLTFVSQNLVGYIDLSKTVDKVTGMAAKLLGQGKGIIEFALDDVPSGLDTIGFKARLGQTISFESMTYNMKSMFNDSWGLHQNYTFLAPVSMSHLVTDNAKLCDMAVGASVSIIAYYVPNVGCYEFRVTREWTGTRVHMELFRWSMINGKVEPTKLVEWETGDDYPQLWTNQTTQQADASKAGSENPSFFGLFISAETKSGNTEIIAGISRSSKVPVASDGTVQSFDGNQFSSNAGYNGYRGLKYIDSDASRLTYGAYGVASKDCPARFMAMQHFESPLPLRNAADTAANLTTTDFNPKRSNAWYFRTSNNRSLFLGETPIYEKDDLDKSRWTYGSRMEPYTNTWSYCIGDMRKNSHGIRMKPDLKQDAVVQLQKKGESFWTDYARTTISGYSYQSASFPLHLLGKWNVRFTTGADNVDIVYDDIVQYRWQANSTANIKYCDEEFLYTQGIVVTNTTRQKVETILWPSRATDDSAVSVRSPMLEHGLGKVSFAYADADANAEVWLQMATNNVESNIGDLSTSIRESPQYGWITLAKYAASGRYNSSYAGKLNSGMGSTGSFTHYVGIHERPDWAYGVFRVYVPTGIVTTAQGKAFKSTDTDYGKITITGLTVSDEPMLSERAWRGWNIRTIGDITDEEQRMFLYDTKLPGEVGNGLTLALNNSIKEGEIKGDVERAVTCLPTIWSPTFGRSSAEYRSGIGSVSFRARLYSTTGRPEESGGGKVTLYGSKNSVEGPWKKLAEFPIADSVFRPFEWSVTKDDDSYLAVKFEISDPSARTTTPTYSRVLLEQVTVCEKVQPSVGFAYARPFRMNLMDPVVIDDIHSMCEQPLVGESWGVQAQIVMKQLADEIDIDHGFEVFLSYYRGEKPWGYEKWKGLPGAAMNIPLVQVGEVSNFVFRSVGDRPESLVSPTNESSVVQFQLMVRYQDRGGIEHQQTIDTYSAWQQPDWFYPIDKNKTYGGDLDNARFSPYTVLDTVSPGRAWINEVNWNDGFASENGGEAAPTEHQYIEICVPSGIPLTDWRVRMTDNNGDTWLLARLGQGGIPDSKISRHASNGYEFLVLQSPTTQLYDGLGKDDDNVPYADGTWNTGSGGTIENGTLSYQKPYQFELIRPSGIVEHQFVMGGTNRWAKYDFARDYDGTNLMAILQAQDHSPKRFYAGDDWSWRTGQYQVEHGSSGVIGGNKEGNPAPGEAGTWRSGLKFTPARLNEGQTIPKGWYLAPNGTNAWVYFLVDGGNIIQRVGGVTNASAVVVIPVGTTTSAVYSVANWYRMSITEQEGDGESHVTASGIGGSGYAHAVTPKETVMYVTAKAAPNPMLKDVFGLDEANPYSPAVVEWLHRNWPDSDADDIRLARHKGLSATAEEYVMSLTSMYWLDIPPVPESEAEATSPANGSNWWLRSSFDYKPNERHIVKRERGDHVVEFTNHVVTATLYISNSVTCKAHAPDKLQGLPKADGVGVSSADYTGLWTGVTFKVLGTLDLTGRTVPWVPFGQYTFDGGSFTGADAPKPFTSKIEIWDPFSTDWDYGWRVFGGSGCFFTFKLDTEYYQLGARPLKAEDTYRDGP